MTTVNTTALTVKPPTTTTPPRLSNLRTRSVSGGGEEGRLGEMDLGEEIRWGSSCPEGGKKEKRVGREEGGGREGGIVSEERKEGNIMGEKMGAGV